MDTVFDELRMISEECEPKELQRFEILRNRFREVWIPPVPTLAVTQLLSLLPPDSADCTFDSPICNM